MTEIDRKLLKWIKNKAGSGRAMPAAVKHIGRGAAERLRTFVHSRFMTRVLAGKAANLDDVTSFMADYAVPLRLPLVLISQVQRSGGTLLSQLFDAHPALAAYPHELKLGFPNSEFWPKLDPARGADENFRMMYDANLARLVRRGFMKGEANAERKPFLIMPQVQYRLFQHLWAQGVPRSRRQILDYFFTAFFNGWLNYQGELAQKRWITAFAPRLAIDEGNAAAFFECYPDGRLIQIIRDPRTWYASLKNHLKTGASRHDPARAMRKWVRSAESMVRNREHYGDRVIILSFEDLVGKTEVVMRALAHELAIDYDPILLEPTFNGRTMKANSSFPVEQAGLIAAPLARGSLLSAEEQQMVERQCLALYQRLAGVTLLVSRPELALA
jgi:hypothetical protein